MSMMTVRMVSTGLYRASHAADRVNPLLGVAVQQVNHRVTGADIAWQAEIGPGLALFHPTGVVIGNAVGTKDVPARVVATGVPARAVVRDA